MATCSPYYLLLIEIDDFQCLLRSWIYYSELQSWRVEIHWICPLAVEISRCCLSRIKQLM